VSEADDHADATREHLDLMLRRASYDALMESTRDGIELAVRCPVCGSGRAVRCVELTPARPVRPAFHLTRRLRGVELQEAITRLEVGELTVDQLLDVADKLTR